MRVDKQQGTGQPEHSGAPEPVQMPRVSERASRVLFATGVGIFVAAFVVLVATGNTAVEVSADEHGAAPLWAVTLPILVGLALVRLIPPRAPEDLGPAVRATFAGRAVVPETLVMLGSVALFTGFFAVTGAPVAADDAVGLLYPLGKVVLFLGVPLLAMRMLKASGSTPEGQLGDLATRPKQLWRWGGLVAVAVVLYLTTFSPLAPPAPSASELPPLPILLILMTGTFLTASVLEEIFFRVWLQTRLELIFGQWTGIVLSSLVFGVMHLATHQALGYPVLDLAQVLAVQGVSGLLYGYLWARYRNVWLPILLHTGVNSLALVAVLVAGM